MNILEVFLNAKEIKLLNFLAHYGIKSEYYEKDDEAKCSILTIEDMTIYTYLVSELKPYLVKNNIHKSSYIAIYMQTWALLDELYLNDSDCEYGYSDLVEMLLSKLK